MWPYFIYAYFIYIVVYIKQQLALIVLVIMKLMIDLDKFDKIIYVKSNGICMEKYCAARMWFVMCSGESYERQSTTIKDKQ